MDFSVFAGDIADASADALCTSTNPRLSLMMGSGASVRARGGFEVLHACQKIAKEELARTGQPLRPGSVHATTAGALKSRIAIHCVACDDTHRSSPQIVAACAENAVRCAALNKCRSVAMPVFASGHAHVPFLRAVEAMIEALKQSDVTVSEVVFVVNDVDRAHEARDIMAAALGHSIPVTYSGDTAEKPVSMWDSMDG